MRRADHQLLTDLLRACFGRAPQPLYPASFAQENGLDRAVLDQALDELRLRGLVRLTEWVQGQGQGYTLTQAGLDLVEHPRGLRPGKPLPVAPRPQEAPLDYEPPPQPLIRPGRPVVSMTLIAINVAIFLVAEPMLSPFSQLSHKLFEHGVLTTGAALREHQWWRLLTYAFLHGGPLHILMNMYFLYSLGPIVEAMWGSGRLLVLYVVAAVTGGCVVIWVGRLASGGQDIPTVGASGALCGLLASLGIWVMLNREHLPPALANSMSRAVTINLVLIGVMSFVIPNVSWEGHLGGALGGAIASFPLQVSRYADNWPRRILGIVGAILVAVGFVALAIVRAR
jgi:membrane associated rhomboid family serine protease